MGSFVKVVMILYVPISVDLDNFSGSLTEYYPEIQKKERYGI